MLAIPSLAGVPTQMVVNYDQQQAAAVALSLLDAGVVDVARCRADVTPAEFSERAIASWWARVQPRFEILPKLYCHIARPDPDSGYACDRPASDAETIVVHVGRQSKDFAADRVVARRVMALERSHEGLGYGALAHVDLAALCTVQVMTPRTAYAMASNAHWQGDEDETTVLEMLREEGEEGQDVYRRAQFERHVPRAAVTLDIWRLRRERRWALPARARRTHAPLVACCDRIRTIARERAIERLHAADLRDRDGGAWTEFGAIARWSAKDDTFRLADDWFQYACQDQCWETFGSWELPLAAAQIRSFFADIERWLELARSLDTLLTLITERAR